MESKNTEVRIRRKENIFIDCLTILSVLGQLVVCIWGIVDDIIYRTRNPDDSISLDHPFWYLFICTYSLTWLLIFYYMIAIKLKGKTKFFELANTAHIMIYFSLSEIIMATLSTVFGIAKYTSLYIASTCATFVLLCFILIVNVLNSKKMSDTLNALLVQLEKDNKKTSNEYKKIYDKYNNVSRVKKHLDEVVLKPIILETEDKQVVEIKSKNGKKPILFKVDKIATKKNSKKKNL